MPVVMPTVTGTRANVAQMAGSTPKRLPAAERRMRKNQVVLKNPWDVDRRALFAHRSTSRPDVSLSFRRFMHSIVPSESPVSLRFCADAANGRPMETDRITHVRPVP